MSRVMTGQVFDPTSGVQEPSTHGLEGHRGTVPPMGGTTVLDLLAVPGATAPVELVDRLPLVVPSVDVEVVLDPRWLLDLHDPTLVISHGYVGPDRRSLDRTGNGPPTGADRWSRLLRRAVQVVVTTVAVVVPLVLIASPAAPPATRAAPPAVAKAVPAPTTGRGHRTAHGAAATSARTARIAAAHQRALARATARAAAAGPVATLTAVTAARGARPAPPGAALVRAAARAQVAQGRADRAAARAAIRGAARSRHAGRGATPPVG